MPKGTTEIRREILQVIGRGVSMPTHINREVGLSWVSFQSHIKFLEENGFVMCEIETKKVKKKYSSSELTVGKLSSNPRTYERRHYFLTDKGKKCCSQILRRSVT